MIGEQRKINCPQCKTEYVPLSSIHHFFGCKKCGQYYKWKEGNTEKIYSFPNNVRSPLSFIGIGMHATFNKKRYTVIARFLYKSQYREYDTEDNGYTQQHSMLEEWYLLSDKGEIICIADDQENFYLSESYYPTAPGLPNPKVPFFSLDKNIKPQRVMERGDNQLLLFEGESPSPCNQQEKIQFVSYHLSKFDFIAEWIGNSTVGYKEISFYKENIIPTETLVNSFEGNDTLRNKYKKLELGKFIFKTFLFASIACLVLWIIGLINSEKEVFTFKDNFYVDDSSSSQVINSREWQLDGEDKIYKLFFQSGYSPDNSNLSVDIDILDANTHEIVNAFEADFWKESGYDDEGSWSEQEVDAFFMFRNKEPGRYLARLTIAKDSTIYTQNGSINVTVYEDVIARYYFYGFIGFTILALSVYFYNNAASLNNRENIGSSILNSEAFWTVVVIIVLAFLFIFSD